jgi:hypothetical protein
MKTKVFVQILILAIIGTAAVQAQENINRTVKKEMKKAKREMRKAKKEMKKTFKDADWEAIVIDEDGFHKFKDGDHWVQFEALEHLDDNLAHLDDILIDLDENIVRLDCLEDLDELKHLDRYYRIEDLHHDFDFDFDFEMPEIPDMPDIIFETPDVNVRTPGVYTWNSYRYESGNVLELSKDLENVSISKEFNFDVNEEASSLELDIEGTLSQGDLTISLKKPNGDLFREFQVSPLADIDWNQKIDLEKEEGEYEGKWTVTLSGSGASGNYKIRIKSK